MSSMIKDEKKPDYQVTCKNEVFTASMELMRGLSNIVGFQKKARIVIDYDPDLRNFTMEVFSQQDAESDEL